MNTPGQMVTDEWLYYSTDVVTLTNASVSQLARGAYEPEIVIDNFIITEMSNSAARTVTIRKIETSGADTSANDIMQAVALAAREVLRFPDAGSLGLVLNAGDTIKALASDNSAVNLTINYRKRR